MLKTHFCEELSLAVILEPSPKKKTMVCEYNTKIQIRFCNIQYFTFMCIFPIGSLTHP